MALPTDNADLETNYSAQDYLDVNASDDVRVGQSGTSQFLIHQYKDFTGGASTANLHWEGQGTQAASTSPIYLQVYNTDTTSWETIDSNNTAAANTDFELSYTLADLTNYRDAQGITTSRVWQEAV